mmetsp:Transcript_67321/g.140644  ORF Transcript_67321/g.140644 Transcript_67321/m.140644 type:complete len:213 (+) Transcript_67321:426-1064(+)
MSTQPADQTSALVEIGASVVSWRSGDMYLRVPPTGLFLGCPLSSLSVVGLSSCRSHAFPALPPRLSWPWLWLLPLLLLLLLLPLLLLLLSLVPRAFSAEGEARAKEVRPVSTSTTRSKSKSKSSSSSALWWRAMLQTLPRFPLLLLQLLSIFRGLSSLPLLAPLPLLELLPLAPPAALKVRARPKSQIWRCWPLASSTKFMDLRSRWTTGGD